MFTPQKLREMAAEQDALVEQSRVEDEGVVPAPKGGAWQRYGYEAMMLRDQLIFAARYMEHFGIKERKQIGPFGNLKVKQGQKVRIRKGAPLFTMGAGPAERLHKEQHGCHRFAKRSYVVTVSQNFEGWCGHNNVEFIKDKYWRENMRDQTIEWAGTGGYWTWTSPEYVEVI